MESENNIKFCANPDCTVENPEFYPSRFLCKKCFNRRCVERKNKKITDRDKKIEDKKIENLQKTRKKKESPL